MLARAIVLKQEESLRKLAESQIIFEEVLHDSISDFRIYVLCSINLCEILLAELKLSENQQTLDHLQNIINKLYEFAQQEHSYLILIESLILKSKLFMIESDFTSAQQAMDQAEITASEKNIQYLEDKISSAKTNLTELITRWQGNLLKNPSIKERIQEIEMLEYLLKIKESKFGY